MYGGHGPSATCIPKAPRLHPAPSPSVYLSIVLTIHNADSQGNHFRLSHFLKMVAENAQAYGLRDSLEIILVDYNPDMAQPALLAAPTVAWPRREWLPLVRALRVPPEAHEVSLCCVCVGGGAKGWRAAQGVGFPKALQEYAQGSRKATKGASPACREGVHEGA